MTRADRRRRFDDDAARDREISQHERRGQGEIGKRKRDRRVHAGDHSDKATAAQRRHHADRAKQRHRAALAGRARRTQIGVGHDHEGERIERRGDAGREIRHGPDPAGLRTAGRPARDRTSSHEISFAHRILDVLRADRRATTGRSRSCRTARARDRVVRSRAAGRCRSRSTRKVPRSFFTMLPCSARMRDAFLRVALIVDEDAEQLTVRLPLADMQRQLRLRCR